MVAPALELGAKHVHGVWHGGFGQLLQGEARARAARAPLPLAGGGLDQGRNAILWYLAEGTVLVPDTRLLRARALQWMFFEQYSHEPYVAVARYILRYLPENSPRRGELPRLQERGHQALAVMEKHLAAADFVAGQYSVADIALYAYTHCAADGGLDLGRYPALRAWLERVRAQPRHVALG